MLKKVAIITAVLFLFGSTNLFASTIAIKDAQNLVQNAVTLIKTDGTKKAFQQINYGDDFTQQEIYVFVIDNEGTYIASGGGLISQIGKNFIDIKDLNGFNFIEEITRIKTKGIVSYKWPNPYTGKEATKIAYIMRVDDYLVGAGVYKN